MNGKYKKRIDTGDKRKTWKAYRRRNSFLKFEFEMYKINEC
jgi:hypothetical protein